MRKYAANCVPITDCATDDCLKCKRTIASSTMHNMTYDQLHVARNKEDQEPKTDSQAATATLNTRACR